MTSGCSHKSVEMTTLDSGEGSAASGSNEAYSPRPKITQGLSTLCGTCTKILDFSTLDFKEVRADYLGHVELWSRKCTLKEFLFDLNFNSNNGCELCALLLKFKLRDHDWVYNCWRYDDRKKAHDDDDTELEVKWKINLRESYLIFTLEREFHSNSTILGMFLLDGQSSLVCDMKVKLTELIDETDVLPERLKIQRELDVDMSSVDNLSLPKKWLANCMDLHLSCEVKHDNMILPSRFLDISPSDEEHIKLCDTSYKRIDGYICLSYCWGEVSFDVTSLADVSSRLQRFNVNELPLTIRDTITITRQLGFRYLWIDSLCIIQDSDEDKDIEIAKMSGIYKHSQLAIIAASAKSVNEGFLGSRPIPEILIRFPFNSNNKKIGTILLRASWDFEMSADPDPTETRAWCLQESVLSPRCLIFSSPNLYWSCYRNPCEQRDTYMGRIASKIILKFPNTLRFQRQDLCAMRVETFLFWIGVMEDYSRRFVTFENDRFRAVSALAREVNAITGYTYAAGHWVENLEWSLLWGSVEQKAIHGTLSAPTWSWLSYSNAVYAMSNEVTQKSSMEIISVQCDLDNTNEPFGSVKGGTIEVRGRSKEVLFWSDACHDNWSNKKNPTQYNHWLSTHLDQITNEKYDQNRAVASLDYTTTEQGKSWNSFQRRSEANLWALASCRNREDYIGHQFQGLLLMETSENNIFKRVGIYKSNGSIYDSCSWFDAVEPTVFKLI